MSENTTCAYCGRSFEKHRSRQKYCSAGCRSRGRDPKTYEHECGHCGKRFLSTSKRSKYCSRLCSGKSNGFRPKEPLLRTCERCGEKFHKRTSSRTTNRFCSRKCSSEFYKSKPKSCEVYFVKCECGVWFTKRWIKRAGDLRCGECEQEYTREVGRALRSSKHVPKILICKECGKSFATAYGVKRRLFCSDICAKRFGSRVGKAKRRARERGAKCDNIDPIQIFTRDKWVCQLCGVKTLMSKRGTTNPRAPELDHIEPLAVGGSHTKDNVQCACRACNGMKGGRLIGQLRLF